MIFQIFTVFTSLTKKQCLIIGNTIDKIELINGDLIVTLTNEEIYNLGQLKGEKGEKG